jgi:amino acid transporter
VSQSEDHLKAGHGGRVHQAEPSAGSFITYVETSLGSKTGVATALLVAVGYTVAIAGVFTMSGGMLELAFAHTSC